MTRSLKRFVACWLFLLVLSSGGLPSDVFASSSPSYQLNGAPQAVESSLSASYDLCSRVGPVPTAGTSTSYVLMPPLNCSVASAPVGGGGGGRRRNVCGDFFVRDSEQCDDGNLINGDGCSDQCMVEPPSETTGTGTTGTGTTGTGTTGTGTTGTGTTGTGTTGTGTTGTGTTGTGTTGTGTTGTGTTGTGTTGTGTTGTGTTGTGTTSTGTTGTDTTGTGTTGTGTTGTVETGTAGIGTTGTTGAESTGTTGTGTTTGTTGTGTTGASPSGGTGTSAPIPSTPGTTPDVIVPAPGGNLFPAAEPVISPQVPPVRSELVEVDIRQTYVTNDIETLFFEQFPEGSGEYEIQLRGADREYQIDVIETTPGYFSFHLLEELPNGRYSIQVRDLQDPDRVLTLNLLVEEQENIESPLLLEFDEQNLSLLETLEGLVTTSLQPVLSGQTILPASIAFYSTQLDQTFIVYTDENNRFTFQYPQALVAGRFEELRIIAHYENGYVSKPQILRFEILETPHLVADEDLVKEMVIFSYLGIVLLFVISSIASLYLFGFLGMKSSIISSKNFLRKFLKK